MMIWELFKRESVKERINSRVSDISESQSFHVSVQGIFESFYIAAAHRKNEVAFHDHIIFGELF